MNDSEQVKAQLREHGISDQLAEQLLHNYSVPEVRDVLRVFTSTYALPKGEQPPADLAVSDLAMILNQIEDTKSWFTALPPAKADKVMRNIGLSCQALGVSPNSPAGFLLMGTFRFVVTNPLPGMRAQSQALINDFNATD